MKKPTRFVVLDTETGGFDAAADSILSLGAVVIAEGKIQEPRFFKMINEGDNYNANEGAIAMNGITREHTETMGVSPRDAVLMLVSWMHKWGLSFGVVMIGANIGFDKPFVQRLFRLAGEEARYNKLFTHRTMDVQSIAAFLEQAGHFDLKGKSASLQNLCQLLDVEIDRSGYHSADIDALATAEVYLKLLARMA